MQQVISQLGQLRSRSRFLLILQRATAIVAWIVGLIAAIIALDYLLRMPAGLRLVLLVAGLGTLGYSLWTYLKPAIRFWPSLTQVALRAEKVFPAVSGRLASSVEFAMAGLDETNDLAARSVQDTKNRLVGESLKSVASTRKTWQGMTILLGVGVVVVAIGLINPQATATGLSRLFAPLGSAQWPARTGIRSLMSEVITERGVYPQGRAMPLRASVTKGDPQQRVKAQYRLKTAGRFGAWQKIVLTHQSGSIHERLIDSTADEIELYFETEDSRSQKENIKLVAPPAVVSARLSITPPSYAAPWFAVYETQLGPGLDERAVTDTASLVESDVALTIEFNKPIPLPTDKKQLQQLLGWYDGELPDCEVDSENSNLWNLKWRLRQTRSLNLSLVDEYDLSNTDTIAYRIEAIEDHPPSVTILRPQNDEPVLATAVVNLVTEARDDVAVESIGLEASIQKLGSAETPSEVAWTKQSNANTPTARLSAEFELGQLNVSVGDTVIVYGIGEDVYQVDDKRHQAVRSPMRRLRIISEVDLATQIRRDLGVIRQNAIRIEAMQAELQDDVIDDSVQPGIDRAQAQIAERIATQRDAIDALNQRMDINNIQDDQLDRLVEQSGDLLDFAGKAANKAQQEILERQDDKENDQLNNQQDANDPDMPDDEFDDVQLREPKQQDRPIVDAQQEVREELTDLISLLDRDEDTWVTTRQLENLLKEQKELEAATADLGRQTLGQSPEELSQEQRSELDRIAEMQRDLLDKARESIEDMRQRASDLEEIDPQGADAMRAAADTGEQRELDRDMEDAAERVEQNQMRNAQTSQQSASQTLEQMLEDIQETKRAQAQELIRRLASLIESIKRLVTVQENELMALANAQHTSEFPGRDRAMIRLSQNTQSVAQEARTSGQEARRIARILDRAADAQGAAVSALREKPINTEQAKEAENRSLELLNEAKELAEQLQEETQQRETDRQRDELMKAYRAFAEQQVAVRRDALELALNDQLNRRQLVEARLLSAAQDKIRVGLSDLKAQMTEVDKSRMFSLVHKQIDRLSKEASTDLLQGDVGIDVTDRQERIANSIGRLVQALEELSSPPEEFAQERQGGGGGGGGGGQLIPPVAELKLLRGMQEQVYDQTQHIDSRIDLDSAQRRNRLSDLGTQQRELLDIAQQLADSLQQNPNRPEDPANEPK
ncbi:MAG: hypothetical protein IH984_01225 [Planctomycetes bacterium]|nr:hypothetical protein [Planctomycetota bacterium]